MKMGANPERERQTQNENEWADRQQYNSRKRI